MTIQELAYQIERLKLLQSLDNDYSNHSWYEGEIHILGLRLKDLLQ
jgi:hypothetical protein